MRSNPTMFLENMLNLFVLHKNIRTWTAQAQNNSTKFDWGAVGAGVGGGKEYNALSSIH
jgi:hypothetical protein